MCVCACVCVFLNHNMKCFRCHLSRYFEMCEFHPNIDCFQSKIELNLIFHRWMLESLTLLSIVFQFLSSSFLLRAIIQSTTNDQFNELSRKMEWFDCSGIMYTWSFPSGNVKQMKQENSRNWCKIFYQCAIVQSQTCSCLCSITYIASW